MKVVYTDEALRDLDEILTFIASNHPSITAAFQQRLRSIERRIGKWPMSAEEVIQRPGLRVAPFIGIRTNLLPGHERSCGNTPRPSRRPARVREGSASVLRMWLVFAFSGPVLWAVSIHLDKYLVSRYFAQSSVAVLLVFTALAGLLLLPPIWFFRPAVIDLL